MSDRTVAEVMGWVELAAWGWHRPGCSDEPWEHVCCCRCGPTPDDMLSWLRERGYKLSAAWWCDVSGYLLEFDRGPTGCVELPPDEARPIHVPTLHAALEAAVLAVSAAQEEET